MNRALGDKLGPAGHRKRLRERFSKSGRHGLADYELLELLLTYAIPRIDTKPVAKALLHQFGTLLNVLQQPREKLMLVHGVGEQTAFFLQMIQSFLTRCTESVLEDQPSVSGPEDIFAFIRLNMGSRPNECIYGLYLDNANRVIHHEEISTGTVDRSPFYPREVLKPALIHNASGLVLVHNHPTGQPVPSENDLELTRNIGEIASALGVKLIDHLVVSSSQAYSIKTGKLL